MAAITKPVTREIVDDFAKEIQQRRTQTAKSEWRADAESPHGVVKSEGAGFVKVSQRHN